MQYKSVGVVYYLEDPKISDSSQIDVRPKCLFIEYMPSLVNGTNGWPKRREHGLPGVTIKIACLDKNVNLFRTLL